VGEATLETRELTVAKAVDELKRLAIGRNPHDIAGFWHDAYRDTYFRGGPILMSALAGVEMALWDIKGKSLGVPVYELLGGKVRDAVPCYANGWFAPSKTPREFAEKALVAVDEFGFRGLKWDPFGSAYMNLSREEMSAAMACVEAVADAVGDRAELLIEAHGRFNVPTAIRIGRALEPYGVLWLEEPIPPDNKSELAEVRRRVPVAIAAGERLYNRWDYLDFFRFGCADFVQPDISHVGGLLEMAKIAAMAECRYLPLCPHNPSGPVANAATLHIAACTPSFRVLETMSSDVPWRKEVTTEALRFRDGCLEIPRGPGLGIDLVDEAIAKHPYEARDLRHYEGTLTDIRPPDAESYFS